MPMIVKTEKITLPAIGDDRRLWCEPSAGFILIGTYDAATYANDPLIRLDFLNAPTAPPPPLPTPIYTIEANLSTFFQTLIWGMRGCPLPVKPENAALYGFGNESVLVTFVNGVAPCKLTVMWVSPFTQVSGR